MSASLDLVRSLYAAWERGDFSETAWAHPDIEYVIADGPDPSNSTGLAKMAESFRDHLGAWEDTRIALEECRELDDERVLALVQYAGRGRTSGVEIDPIWARAAALFQLREGRVTRITNYWNRERALAALGLAPEAGAAEAPG